MRVQILYSKRCVCILHVYCMYRACALHVHVHCVCTACALLMQAKTQAKELARAAGLQLAEEDEEAEAQACFIDIAARGPCCQA